MRDRAGFSLGTLRIVYRISHFGQAGSAPLCAMNLVPRHRDKKALRLYQPEHAEQCVIPFIHIFASVFTPFHQSHQRVARQHDLQLSALPGLPIP